jgi:ATP-dependent exoDNAse (exonuclease V) alpha subunit
MDKYTGKQLSNNEDRQNIIPITEYVDDITLKVNGIHYMRWQIPLIVAYSITTHKSQSMTAHNGIVYEPSIRSPFTRGLPYVALSRATDLDKVSLLSAIRNDHFISNKFLAENETIANFYSLLKKNYSTDVALIDK